MSKKVSSHSRNAIQGSARIRRGRAPTPIAAGAPLRYAKAKCGISILPRDLHYMILLVKKEPAKAALHCQAKIDHAEISCNEMKYRAACVAYEFATDLRTSNKRWLDFASLPFWTGYRRKMCPDEVLRFCMMYMRGSRQGSIANEARDHARALMGAWDKQIATADLYYELQRGGFSRMKSEACQDQDQKAARAGRRQVFFIDEIADTSIRSARPGDGFTMLVKLFQASPKPIFLVTRASKVSDATASPGRSHMRRCRRGEEGET